MHGVAQVDITADNFAADLKGKVAFVASAHFAGVHKVVLRAVRARGNGAHIGHGGNRLRFI